jgi:hypothetical protein
MPQLIPDASLMPDASVGGERVAGRFHWSHRFHRDVAGGAVGEPGDDYAWSAADWHRLSSGGKVVGRRSAAGTIRPT